MVHDDFRTHKLVRGFFRVMLCILYIRGFDLPHFLGVQYAEYGYTRELLIVQVPTLE